MSYSEYEAPETNVSSNRQVALMAAVEIASAGDHYDRNPDNVISDARKFLDFLEEGSE